MKVKNLSEVTMAIPGIPAFGAGEVREVSEEEGSLLLGNPNFEAVSEEKTEGKKKSEK